jgi:flagellar hook protein FlgE
VLRSLYSGISGMKVNQIKLDVIGNNVANVGTTAFKSSRTRFQDMLSQNINSALAPSLNQGGVNPNKVGLGVKLAGIDSVMSQGYMQPTSRNLDMAVDGEGYFMVSKGPRVFEEGKITLENQEISGTDGSDIFYSRDGSFTLDAEGNLLNSDGLRVLGYMTKDTSTVPATNSMTADGKLNFIDADVTKDVVVDGVTKKVSALEASTDLVSLRIPDRIIDGTDELRIVSFSVEKDGLIKAVCEGGKVSILGQIAMSSFKNPAGLEKLGSNLYRNSPNSGAAVVRTGFGAAEDNGKGYGDVLQGMLEMSNVDLAEQFTEMITTSRAFQASGKMITTGDEILQDIINLKR